MIVCGIYKGNQLPLKYKRVYEIETGLKQGDTTYVKLKGYPDLLWPKDQFNFNKGDSAWCVSDEEFLKYWRVNE